MAKLPDPELVATGRIRVPVEQLVALVHAVNPSDKGLNPKEKANRYVLKSRLQSLLIREHKDSFEVVATGEGVVSLRHRVDGHDACHAVVTELEDDARRWIETELALRKSTRKPPPKPVAAPIRTDALARGRAALDDYDYDTARAEFESALPAAAAVRALLDLFVNHLADDAEALALATRFPDLAAEPDLAMAAARADDPRAEAWARASRSADALARLAEATSRHDAGRAVRLLDALKDVDAAHPAVARISAALADRRKEERGPMEAALAGIADPLAKEAAARDILRRWPESTAARAALKEAEDHRRHAATDTILAAALQAAERHDYDAILGIVERARRDAAEFDARLEALEARARGVTRALRIHRALIALNSDDFELWLALPQAERDLARRDATHPLLSIVERIPAGNTRAAAGSALVRAHADPAAAPELLRPYERLLHGIPEAWRLVEVELGRRSAAATDQRLGKLDRAEAALAAGDLDAAEKLAADAKTSAERERVATIRKRIAAAREAARRAERLRELRESGDLVGALAEAHAQGDAASIRELDAALREAWHVDFVTDSPHAAEDTSFDFAVLDAPVGLTPRGELVLVRTYADDLFVSRCPPDTTSPDATFAVRLPERFELSASHVDEISVWAIARTGALVRIDLGDGHVRLWRSAPPLDGEDRFVEYASVAVGGRHVWMTVCDPFAQHELRVYDVEAWPHHRTITPWGHAHPLLGSRSPGVGVTRNTTGAMLYTPAGTRIHERSAMVRMPATRLALSPDGNRLVGLGNAAVAVKLPELAGVVPPEMSLSGADGPDLIRFDVGIENKMASVALLTHAKLQLPHHLATSRTDGNCYLRVQTSRGAEVSAQSIEGVRFTLPVPRHTVLVTDEQATRVRAIALRTTGIHEIPLLAPDPPLPDPEPDADEDDPADLRPSDLESAMGGIEVANECAVGLETRSARAEDIFASLRGRPRDEVLTWLSGARETHAGDADMLVDLAGVARRVEALEIAWGIRDDLKAHHAGNPRWRLYEAARMNSERKWEDLVARLADLDPASLPDSERQHLFHMRAIAALRVGEIDAAEAHLAQALATPGDTCKLDGLRRFLAIRRGAPGSGHLESLVATIASADRLLAKGDAAGAFALCETRPVWLANEAQSWARRAAAALALGPGEGADRLRRRIALRAFADLWTTRDDYVVTNLPVEGAWDEARLDELARRGVEVF